MMEYSKYSSQNIQFKQNTAPWYDATTVKTMKFSISGFLILGLNEIYVWLDMTFRYGGWDHNLSTARLLSNQITGKTIIIPTGSCIFL